MFKCASVLQYHKKGFSRTNNHDSSSSMYLMTKSSVRSCLDAAMLPLLDCCVSSGEYSSSCAVPAGLPLQLEHSAELKGRQQLSSYSQSTYLWADLRDGFDASRVPQRLAWILKVRGQGRDDPVRRNSGCGNGDDGV